MSSMLILLFINLVNLENFHLEQIQNAIFLDRGSIVLNNYFE
jgi:hypothetical protein